MGIELRERTIKAAKRYLEVQGLEVIDEAWRILHSLGTNGPSAPAGAPDPLV